MIPSAKIIADTLGSEGLWSEFGQEAVQRVLTEQALNAIDVERLDVNCVWNQLDDPLFRRRRLLARGLEDELVGVLCEHRSHFDKKISDALGLSRLSNRSFRESAVSAVEHLRQSRGLDSFVARPPFPDLYHRLAVAVARRVALELDPVAAPEWQVLRYLALANYFRYCNLPTAKDFLARLRAWRSKPLKIRGHCFHIAHRVSSDGFADVQLSSSGNYTCNVPAHQTDPFLLEVARIHSRLKRGISGFAAHIGGGQPQATAVEEAKHRGLTSADLENHRRLVLKQFEWYCLGFLATSAIERLLRGYAQQKSVVHMRSDGRPISVAGWLKKLGLPLGLQEAVADLYSRKGTNVRNMLMHSALNGVEGIRQELIIAANPSRHERHLHRQNPSSPHQVATRLIEVLAHLCRAIPVVYQADYAWSAPFDLAPEEVDFLNRLRSELLNPEGDWELSRETFDYVRKWVSAIAPGLVQFFNIGSYFWMGESDDDSPLAFSLLVLAFEGLLRVTVHLSGDSVLQRSMKNGVFTAGYRVLGTREDELVNDQSLQRFLSELERDSHPNATRVLMNAIGIRNACSHGAFPDLSGNNHRVYGHAFIKSFQLLTGAGIRHLQREEAYYRWKVARSKRHGHDVEDWHWAEQRTLKRVDDWAKNLK